MKDNSAKQVLRLPTFNKANAADEIQRIAREDSGRVFFLDHACMRMKEREITHRQVFKVLRDGELIKDPEWSTKEERGWKCTFRRITAGECLHVAVKLIEREETTCLVITSYNRR